MFPIVTLLGAYLTSNNFLKNSAVKYAINHSERYWNIPAIVKFEDIHNPLLDDKLGIPKQLNKKTYFGKNEYDNVAFFENGDYNINDKQINKSLPGETFPQFVKNSNMYFKLSESGIYRPWKPRKDATFSKIRLEANKPTLNKMISKDKETKHTFFRKDIPVKKFNDSILNSNY